MTFSDGAPGWFSGEEIRKRAALIAEVDAWALDGLAEIMRSLIADQQRPGPPYVHTIVPPAPVGWDEDGDPLYPEPGPAMTLTERPIADVVAEAGFGPVPERIEVTADFCQCPACREGRCETVQPERTGCYWPIEDPTEDP